ncbi:hypothetical protein ABBQ32_003720 [Trebouxia sp. C0010 RCD-2024]
MNDLLGQISGDGMPSRLYSAADLEAGPAMQHSAAEHKQMDEFFSEVTVIRAELVRIKEAQENLLAAHDKSKVIARSADMMEIRETMQDHMDDVSKIAHNVKARLELLQQGNQAALEHKKSRGASSTELHYSYERTRTTVTAGLCKKLKDLMGDFQAIRQQLTDDHREVVERRIHIVTGKKPSSQDVDRLIDTGESDAVFKTAIQKQGRGHALETMAEIQERHEAIKDLERSLVDLHQVFLDMSVLVDAQGDMLGNIEQQVGESKLSVETGVNELVQAKIIQKKSRRWMCWAASPSLFKAYAT